MDSSNEEVEMGAYRQHRWPRLRHPAPRRGAATTTYRLTDRLHDGRTVHVPASEIVCTVSAWLAELGVHSPLVEDLVQALGSADWQRAHAIGEYLGIDVAVAGLTA
jgi:hypothetical protein